MNWLKSESKKIIYEAPAVTILDVRQEGMICQSNGINPMGDPEIL